jgi:hypothetical protein
LFLTEYLPWEDLRFEHKLQTAMRRRRRAPSQFLSIAHGIGATGFQQLLSLLAYASRAKPRLSSSLKVSASLAHRPSSAHFGAEGI